MLAEVSGITDTALFALSTFIWPCKYFTSLTLTLGFTSVGESVYVLSPTHRVDCPMAHSALGSCHTYTHSLLLSGQLVLSPPLFPLYHYAYLSPPLHFFLFLVCVYLSLPLPLFLSIFFSPPPYIRFYENFGVYISLSYVFPFTENLKIYT